MCQRCITAGAGMSAALVWYDMPHNGPDWAALRERLTMAGYTMRTIYRRSAPAPDTARIWELGGQYVTDTGHQVMPWALFAAPVGSRRTGYYIEGITPPQSAPAPVQAPRTTGRPPRPSTGRAAQAARWYMAGHGSRQQAAQRYGVALPTLHEALHRLFHPDLIAERFRQARQSGS
jgi:hypothetical protein